MKYKAGYKYQLHQDESVFTGITPEAQIDGAFYTLCTSGLLTVKAGYAWDGPSGPTFDTKSFMRGSLFHDALYQMMGEGKLSVEKWRKLADKVLVDVCKADGMTAIRRAWVYAGVRVGGGSIASSPDIVLEAP
jgi:hypothetical protein